MTLLVSELSQFLIERVKIAKTKTSETADQVAPGSVDVNAVQVD
jgi:hypothetical protein